MFDQLFCCRSNLFCLVHSFSGRSKWGMENTTTNLSLDFVSCLSIIGKDEAKILRLSELLAKFRWMIILICLLSLISRYIY